MFVVAQKRLFWWPVTVSLPHPETPGAFTQATFEMRFEALPLDRARQMDEARAALPEAERPAHAFDYLYEIARDWRDVVDESRAPIPFTREALEAQLQFPWFRDGLIAAYQQAVTGQAARLGNSEEPRAH